jgi:hypothetical protein
MLDDCRRGLTVAMAWAKETPDRLEAAERRLLARAVVLASGHTAPATAAQGSRSRQRPAGATASRTRLA